MNLSKQIVQSWEANAANWITTIDNNEIKSRILVTNDAIVNAIVKYHPDTILDIGCGEGWLSRTLRQKGLKCWGTDAVAELIDAATAKDGEFYYRASYQDIANGNHQLPLPYGSIVINFALLDKDDADELVMSLASLLHKDGLVFIQTLHPLAMIEKDDYVTGWKEGSWTGMKQNFTQPYDWYFRTFEDWFTLFIKSGFTVLELLEPLHPESKKPLSVIFILKLNNSI